MDYLTFFGFADAPFRLAPDPQYFFPSYSHQEALQTLLYSVRAGEGFIQITGDPGTGKTLLLRTMLKELGADVQTALILNPNLSPQDLLRVILDDFALTNDDDEIFSRPKDQLIRIFRDFLLAKAAEGCKTVIIVDEAQNLPLETMEELRLLSNLETDKQKLLQIFLVGQRELEQKIEDPGLRQLSQRITIRYVLPPFSREETVTYINHRLKIAAAADAVTFSPDIVDNIYQFSQGTPRLINIVCERCLMAAYIDEKKEINRNHLKSAVHSIKGESPARVREPAASRSLCKFIWAGFLLIGLAGALFLSWKDPRFRTFVNNFSAASALKSGANKAPALKLSAPQSAPRPAQPEGEQVVSPASPAPETSAPFPPSSPAAAEEAMAEASAAAVAPAVPAKKEAVPLSPLPEPQSAAAEPQAVVAESRSSAAEIQSPAAEPPAAKLPPEVLNLSPGWPLLRAREGDLTAELWIRKTAAAEPEIINHLQLPAGIGPGLWLTGIKSKRPFLFNPVSFPFHQSPAPPETWRRFFLGLKQPVIPLLVMPEVAAGRGPAVSTAPTRTRLHQFFQDWATAWRQLDLDKFMSFYGPIMTFYKPDSFKPFSFAKNKLSEIKKNLFQKTHNLKLELSAPLCLFDPTDANLALLFFYQDYRSNNYRDKGYKALFLSRSRTSDNPEQWRIVAKFFVPVRKKAAPAPRSGRAE